MPTEPCYAQIKKEMLAIVFALKKFNHYTYGLQVKVQSDHKPLESILRKPLSSAPRRLQGMMMRLQKYASDVRYERGKNMQDFMGHTWGPSPAIDVLEN